MSEYVIIEAFSDKLKVSERKAELCDFYDGECEEIDDVNFITRNKITKVVITNPMFNQKSYNYYDNNGLPSKFISFENDILERIEFCCRSDFVKIFNAEFIVHDDYTDVNLSYKLNCNAVIKGGITGCECDDMELFCHEADVKENCSSVLFTDLRIYTSKKHKFCIDIIADGEIRHLQ